jgi:hypothetical protein
MTFAELVELVEIDVGLSLAEAEDMELCFNTSPTKSLKVLSVYSTEGKIEIDLGD